MNYAFATERYVGALTTLDYSRSTLPPLDEKNLVEPVGIGPNTAVNTRFFNAARRRTLVSSQGGIDWNQDGDVSDVVTTWPDINNDGICITQGNDNVLHSRTSRDDQYVAVDGIGSLILANPRRDVQGDDRKFVDGATGDTTVVTGPNGILDTPVQSRDVLRRLAIANGNNRNCESSVSSRDKEEAKENVIEPNELRGHDDWSAIELDRLFKLKGGLEDTPLPTPTYTPPNDLPYRVFLQQAVSDIAVDITSSFSARAGEASYAITVRNLGPQVTYGEVMVFFDVPVGSARGVCEALDGASCVFDTRGRGVILRMPQLDMQRTFSFHVTQPVDASHCATPEVYDGRVMSWIGNVERDPSNDTYVVPFPDADGDGIPDVCRWPVNDFAVYAHRYIHVDRAEVLGAAGSPDSHGLIGKRDVGTPDFGSFLIGPDAAVGDVYSGGNLRVGGQTTIHGHITAGGRIRLGPGAAVAGRVVTGLEPSQREC